MIAPAPPLAAIIGAMIGGLWLGMLLSPKAFPRETSLRDTLAWSAQMFPEHYSLRSGKG